MTTMGLTPRMRKTFDAIKAHIAAHGSSPSYSEIAEATGLTSRGQVHSLVAALRERGYVEKLHGKGRSIAITEGGSRTSYLLPPHIQQELARHCASFGDDPADVVEDAVTIFLDLPARGRM